jgi:LysM repeat protein
MEAQNVTRMWAERGVILEQLLGPDWAVRNRNTPIPSNTNAPQNQILATLELNPVLQALSANNKRLVAALLSQSPAVSGTTDAMADGNWDASKVAAEEKARWTKLTEILTVEQLEAAKLHFSIQAEDLRNELDALPGFNTQPDEFRKIFRNTESIEAQLAALASREDDAAQKERATLTALRETAVRSALSPTRYELYARLSDPAYLEAMETMGGGTNSAEAVGLLYAINRERTAEQERIANDPTLSDAHREIELKRLELEQLKAVAQALGEDVGDEPGQTKPRPEPMKTHPALPGEGLERIARIYGIPPEALRAANPNLDFTKLPPGANVNVPLRLIYPLPPPPE